MNDVDNFTAVHRTSKPNASVDENGGITVRVNLNVEPDDEWDNLFHRGVYSGDGPHIIRPDRNAYSGPDEPASELRFRIGSVDDLPEATRYYDELIEDTNRRYVDVLIPAERARAEAERRQEAERSATQAELDRISAELLPPDGGR